MKINYREFKREDTTPVLALSKDEWRGNLRSLEPLLAKYDGQAMKCYLAEAEGVIVGMAAGFPLPNRMLLPELVYVLPQCRHLGVGTKLMRHLEKASGCKSAIVYYNRSLHDQYAKWGYLASDQIEVAIKSI